MEGGEDLNVEYKPDPNIDYREEFLNKYKNYNFEENKVDDSYIELNDKKNLIRYCKDIVSTSYNMYPEPMATILTKKLYYDTIRGMDKEAYLKEKQELKELDFVDRELKILNDNETLNHILNDKKE
tara:strand:- start:890 stop:1267 length:378 start_codon:yes stop_codon:yes gene_type:complete